MRALQKQRKISDSEQTLEQQFQKIKRKEKFIQTKLSAYNNIQLDIETIDPCIEA